MAFSSKPRTYVALFLAYLANAVYALYVSIHPSAPLHQHVTKPGVLIPFLTGDLLLLVLIPVELKRARLLIERTALVFTEAIIVLCFVGNLHELGVSWCVIPLGNSLLAIISSIAAVLIGVRMVQVLAGSSPAIGR